MLHHRMRAAAGARGGGGGIPLTGLVAAYDLDGDLLDWQGANDGTAVSSISYTTGVIGQAVDGDGVNYISLPALGVTGSTPRTISFWYKMGASNSIKTVIAWDSGAPSDNAENCIVHVSAVSTGDIYWAFSNRDFYVSPQMNSSEFKHVVLIYDGGNLEVSTVRIYVNGVDILPLSSAGTYTGPAQTANSNYRLMSDSLGSNISDGALDLVRIYNRALSSSEVTALYNEV